MKETMKIMVDYYGKFVEFYDENGNLTKVIGSSHMMTHFDRYGNLVDVSSYADDTSMYYYKNGKINEIIVPCGYINFYDDNENHVKTVLPDGYVIFYDADGETPTKIIHPDGDIHFYNKGRLTKELFSNGNISFYDDNGNHIKTVYTDGTTCLYDDGYLTRMYHGNDICVFKK